MRDNPDFDAAQAALREANENVSARQGTLFPSVTAGIQSERERLAGAVIGQPRLTPTFSVTTASLNVSYAPDVLGGTRRQIESLAARAEYQKFALEATYLTLTSNLVVAAVQEASLRAQIAATGQILGIESDELNLIRERFRVGVVSQAEVLLQEATLDQTRTTLPPLQKQLAQVRNQLTALVGATAESGSQRDIRSRQSYAAAGITRQPSLPAHRAAAGRARGRGGAARGFRRRGYRNSQSAPAVRHHRRSGRTMTGFPILPGTGVWSIAGSVGQTLFDAGTLLHEKRAAVAALDQAAAQYRSTVIKAFENVADALRALQSDAENLAAQDAAERSSQASLELARRQFHAETIDYLTVLTAERTWQEARINRLLAESSRYADTAALFQALGGGWWHRTDVAQSARQ